MRKFKELSRITKAAGDPAKDRDLDAERREDIKQLGHATKKWLHWTFRIMVVVGLVVFLPFLLFAIGPVSYMELEHDSRWIPFQRWAVSFLSTARTAIIALLTIIVTDLLKRFFSLYRKSIYPEDDD